MYQGNKKFQNYYLVVNRWKTRGRLRGQPKSNTSSKSLSQKPNQIQDLDSNQRQKYLE